MVGGPPPDPRAALVEARVMQTRATRSAALERVPSGALTALGPRVVIRRGALGPMIAALETRNVTTIVHVATSVSAAPGGVVILSVGLVRPARAGILEHLTVRRRARDIPLAAAKASEARGQALPTGTPRALALLARATDDPRLRSVRREDREVMDAPTRRREIAGPAFRRAAAWGLVPARSDVRAN